MNAQTVIEAQTLSSAMALAFGEIDAAIKSNPNAAFKNGGKVSMYADINAVIEAIKPALINHGLFFTQHPKPSDKGVTVETVLHHANGEHYSLGELFVPANKQDAQGFGSALTYARRYALVTAFGVPVEDDDGNAAAKGQSQQGAGAARPLTADEWAKIVALCQATGSQSADVKKHIGATNLKLLTAEQFTNAVDYLEQKLADAAKAETDAKAKEPA